MRRVVCFFVFCSLTSCASRQVKVLDAPWVSMKNSEAPDASMKLAKAGSVDERYCLKSWSGSFGLMDEVVKQAETKHKIDYIRNASFNKDEGRECMNLVGEGYRIVR